MNLHFEGEDISLGIIQVCKCDCCGFRGDDFHISGNMWSMSYIGIIGLSSTKGRKIYLTKLTSWEFNNYAHVSAEEVANRVMSMIANDSLVYLKKESDEKGKVHKRCPACRNSLKLLEEVSLQRYVDQGGEIIIVSKQRE